MIIYAVHMLNTARLHTPRLSCQSRLINLTRGHPPLSAMSAAALPSHRIFLHSFASTLAVSATVFNALSPISQQLLLHGRLPLKERRKRSGRIYSPDTQAASHLCPGFSLRHGGNTLKRLGFEAIKGLDWHWSRSTFGGLGGRLHQLGENWRTLAISPSTFETFEGLAGIATDLALFGFFPKTPNAAKQPNSGQVAASRGNSRVIFLMYLSATGK
jgi:hypothetical protein